MRLNRYLTEEYIETFSISPWPGKEPETTEIFLNPSKGEFNDIKKQSGTFFKDFGIRGLSDSTGKNIIIWKGNIFHLRIRNKLKEIKNPLGKRLNVDLLMSPDEIEIVGFGKYLKTYQGLKIVNHIYQFAPMMKGVPVFIDGERIKL